MNEMIDALLSGSAASSSGRHTNIAAIVAPVVIAGRWRLLQDALL